METLYTYTLLTVSAWLVYLTALVVHRSFLSPLAKFPGPRLAAATYLYEIYYGIVEDGQYVFKIKDLHAKFGPVIRINPHELHVSDPNFYSTIYSAGPRRKWAYHTNQFGTDYGAVVVTQSAALHAIRRKPLEPFFSPMKVKRSESMIRSKIERLCERIDERKTEKRESPVKYAMLCSTTDIVTEYCFRRSYNYLTREDFFPQWNDIFSALGHTATFLRQAPWLAVLLEGMPSWIIKILSPGVYAIETIKRDARASVEDIVRQKDKGDKQYLDAKAHPTVFHESLESNSPPAEKTITRLQYEGFQFLGAGSETSATVLAVTIFYVSTDASVEGKLRKESEEAMSNAENSASLQVSEKSPYSTGVVKEGSRLSHGAIGRMQRIADSDLVFHQWIIPAGTPCATSALVVHSDPSIWPEPEKFRPERWLDPAERDGLGKYIVAFTKGSRSCLGIHSAYAESYMTIAAVFRRYRFRSEITDPKQLRVVADHFVPVFATPAKDMRIWVE